MQPAPGLAYRDLRGKCQIYTKLVSQRPQNPLGNNQLISSIFHFRGQKFDLVLFVHQISLREITYLGMSVFNQSSGSGNILHGQRT